MIKPNHLNKGDKVAIVSLSSGILGESSTKHQVALGISRLKEMDLDVSFMPNALKGLDYIKNNPEARANDLIEAFKDKSIKAIICAIGGDDTYRTIPYLLKDDCFKKIVLENPKIFIGFSDSTHNHFVLNHIGLVTYYGLNFLTDICELGPSMLPYSIKSYDRFFSNPESFKIESSDVWYKNRTKYDQTQLGVINKPIKELKGYETINGIGNVEGVLFGGCFESIMDIYRFKEVKEVYQKHNLLPNTDFFEDKVLFIETSEDYFNPDDFEMHMFDLMDEGYKHAKALIFGKPYDEIHAKAYKETLVKISNTYQIPMILNVNFGHSLPHAMIPYGINININFDKKELTLVEKQFNDGSSS